MIEGYQEFVQKDNNNQKLIAIFDDLQVIKEERTMPQSAQLLLGEAFTAAGAQIRYSMDKENDDTLAAHAQVRWLWLKCVGEL